jgi:hypothetical protein
MATESKTMLLGEVQLVVQVLSIYSRFISKYYHGICLQRLKKTMKTDRIANNKAPSKYHCTTLLLHQPTWYITSLGSEMCKKSEQESV